MFKVKHLRIEEYHWPNGWREIRGFDGRTCLYAYRAGPGESVSLDVQVIWDTYSFKLRKRYWYTRKSQRILRSVN